jgi:Rod binding domain-containing protein
MQTSNITPVSSQKHSAEQIIKVAHEFESMFNAMMIRAMRKTVGDNPLLPASMGEKIYTEMLDDKYSEIISSNTSSGLSSMIIKELEKQTGIDTSLLNELKDVGKFDLWMLDKKFTPSSKTTADTNNKLPVISRIKKWEALITEAATKYDLDKNLVSAVIAQESAGNPYAVSKAGAKGLMQLMDSTAKELGVRQSYSPVENIGGGTKYLKQLLDKFSGNEKLALASYNAGPAAVQKYNGIPPYKETIHYVDAVLKYKELFSQKD